MEILGESALSSYHVGSRDESWVLRLQVPFLAEPSQQLLPLFFSFAIKEQFYC